MTGSHQVHRDIAEAARTLKGRGEITDAEKVELREKVNGWEVSL